MTALMPVLAVCAVMTVLLLVIVVWLHRSVVPLRYGVLLVLFGTAASVVHVWSALPGRELTLQMGRGVHFNVTKHHDDADVVTLEGNRDEYGLNPRLDAISPHVIDAVVATEDRRFFEDHHRPYMVARFVQAFGTCLVHVATGGSRHQCRGHSSIPQQLAKILWIGDRRTYGRKFRELVWALKMETVLTKEEILQLYLDRVPLGARVAGVEAAARTYFGKSSERLTVEEAAVIVAAVRRPRTNWGRDQDGTIRRANVVLRVLHETGHLDTPLTLPADWGTDRGYRRLVVPYFGHLWEWVRPTVVEALRGLPAGRYKVYTPADAEVQIYAEKHLKEVTRELRRDGQLAEQGSVVVMRADGAVLAMVGGAGRDAISRSFNRAIPKEGLHCRPPASVMKTVTYTAALEAGLTLDSMIDASPVLFDDGSGRIYRPRNHDGSVHGTVRLDRAFVESINTAAVRLVLDRIGYENWVSTAVKYGVPADRMPRELGNAIGQSETCLIHLMGIYGTVAAHGLRSTPRGVLMIVDADAATVFDDTEYRSARMFDEDVMRAMESLLVAAVAEGTGAAANRDLDGLRIAGKTGTTNGFTDALFVGYARDVVLGVWIGNDVPRSMPGLYGGTAPADVFARVFGTLRRHTDMFDDPLVVAER